jgi:glycosyltransferase involved in cell wall biosynthesis/GT2 family glycosyltransferase
MRQGYQGAQDLDLFLRLAENTTPTRIKHIPHICYHWRNHPESTASHGTQKQYVFDSACRAIADTIERRGLKAKPFLPKIAQQYGLCLYQLKWDNSLLAENAVTIVIPTRDKVNLLAKCISSLQKTVDERYVKLLIVDDCSQKLETKKYLEQLEREEVLQCRIIYPERETDSFNYARLMNIAAQQVDTPYMLHLNNDVEAIESGWLEDMVGWMSIEDVGVVGARLLYPNYTIQHAGVVIGSHEGLADHLFHYLHQDEVGYICLPHAARNSSAVTGACLLTSTNLYRELEGFDQDNFAVQYNDVDYCLKVIRSGKRIVYTPQATLIHRESESRGKVYDYQEHINFLDKYANFSDPFFNENIDIDSMTMAVNPNHFCHLKRITKLKLLFITHNLNLEGAPLILYRYAAYFVKQGGYEICVVSPQDGYLRQEYEKLNISVKLFPNCFPAMGEKLEQFRSRLNQLGYSLDLSSFDLIVGNTLLSFWGIELARLFNLPSIWHIHESTGIEKSFNTFFVDTPEKIMEQLLPQCFKNASRVVFQAEATRKLYHKYDFQGNFRTIPGGIDVEEIENFCQLNPKSYLRSQYEIDQDKVIISIIGTTCDRKGQHIFVEAIKELAKIDIEVSSNIIGMIVGAREGKYLDSLKNKIQALNLENILIYPETQTVYDFFAMSDIFVCASFEESFPRVILEAMAFKLKIISTDVFGIAEIISDKNTAYLVKPGDPRSLAQKIYKCLKNSDFSARLAKNGYATVCRKFNNKNLLPQHISLAKEGILSYLRDLSPN